MKPRIEIRKNNLAEQPYHVVYLSNKNIGHGQLEKLSHTENLPNRNDCLANIRSMASIFAGVAFGHSVTAMDYTRNLDGEIIQIKL